MGPHVPFAIFRKADENMRYNKQILSNALADLGAKLGRVPTPKDLTKGMATMKTYFRWFGDWDTALEYAGYTKEIRERMEKEAEEKAKPIQVQYVPKNGSDWRNSRIINLLPYDVYLVGADKTIGPLKSEGSARITIDVIKTRAESLLRKQTGGVPIVTTFRRNITVEVGGQVISLSNTEKKVFYIVPKQIAKGAKIIGINASNLLYPRVFLQRRDFCNGAMFIHQLGIVHSNKLWLDADAKKKWEAARQNDPKPSRK